METSGLLADLDTGSATLAGLYCVEWPPVLDRIRYRFVDYGGRGVCPFIAGREWDSGIA